MAKTEIFSAGGAIADIEQITGIEAPVAADFTQVPFGTIVNEHGIERRIQNQQLNLRSSSGIERISFNGIDELDTERGPNGETVYALNTGDSRIRFINGVETWASITSSNSGGSQPGSTIQVASTGAESLNNTDLMGSVEITFFGTALNILSFSSVQPTNWLASVDGGTATQISPNNNTVNLTQSAQFDLAANRNTKVNQVVPIVSGLTPGVHTVRIDGRRHGSGDSGTGGTELALFGCEIINESADITQQAGADFNSNITLRAGSSFPIKPDNTIVPSLNSSSGVLAALTSPTNGARVLNYITSAGNLKQAYEPVVETLTGAGSALHTITFSASGAGAVTLPADVTSWSILTFGGGGGGGGSAAAFAGNIGYGGGGGGAGGGRSFSNFTKTGGGTTAIVTTVGIQGTAGARDTTFLGTGATAGGDGGTTSITVGGTELISAGGGGGGGRGTATFNSGTGGTGGTAGIGSGSDGAKGSTNITAQDTLNSLDTNAGDDARDGGDGPSAVISLGNTANLPGGTAGAGAQPGGVSGGVGGGIVVSTTQAGSAGAAGGRIVMIFQSSTTTTLTVTNGTDNVVFTGAEEFAPFFNFGTTDHSRQEVVRRINFREFGANSQWAILNGTSPNTLNAFTLDDGTTTLSGNCQQTTQDGLDILSFANNANFVTLTFVGTGLDIFRSDSANGGDDNYAVLVDGLSIGRLNAVTVGSTTTHPGSRIPRITPIVSGLAYGTHTVQFDRVTASTYDLNIADFIIYGPKKPEIPTDDAGSKELSEYNVMADFVADTANNINSMSKGILGKAVARECILSNGISGSARWSTELSTDGNNYGSRANEIGDGSTREELFYTFYGDAFSMRMKSNTVNSASNHEFFLDGVQITRTNTEGWDVDEVIFLNNTNNGTSDPSQVWPTVDDVPRFDGSDTTKIIFPPSFNMGLGVHTIRIRHAANSPAIFYGMEVGTPIHINEDNLKVGSQGLDDLRIDPVVEEDEIQVQNLGEAKAWINFDITTSSTINSSHNISAVIRASDSTARYYFDKPFKDSNYVVISTIFDTNNSPAATVLEQRANYVAINASLSGNEKQYIVCFGELIDE